MKQTVVICYFHGSIVLLTPSNASAQIRTAPTLSVCAFAREWTRAMPACRALPAYDQCSSDPLRPWSSGDRGRETVRQRDRETERQRYRNTEAQKDRKTDTQEPLSLDFSPERQTRDGRDLSPVSMATSESACGSSGGGRDVRVRGDLKCSFGFRCLTARPATEVRATRVPLQTSKSPYGGLAHALGGTITLITNVTQTFFVLSNRETLRTVKPATRTCCPQ